MRVRLTKKHPHLTRGQEYEVLGLQGVSYRLLDDDGMPRLFERVHFETTETRAPSFWISQIRGNGELYQGPDAWSQPGFFDDWFHGVEETVHSFWWDLYKLYPWTVQTHSNLPARTRYSIYVDHVDDPSDYLQVMDWLNRWADTVRVADYHTGGWEHLWDVEAPPEAITELPEEFLTSSAWADSLPYRRIQ